jgi:hypothetical protein
MKHSRGIFPLTDTQKQNTASFVTAKGGSTMETFFLYFGVASFSWYLTKFLFWLDEPNNHKKPHGGSIK